MKRPKRDPVREDRIHNEAIVDASPDEQAMSWYYYLESKISFPFQAKCLSREGRLAAQERGNRRGRTHGRRKKSASTTCSSWSDGRVETWPSRSLNSPPSIQTNQPLKLSVTGITGWRRATVSELDSRCAPFSTSPISRRNSPAIPYAALPKGHRREGPGPHVAIIAMTADAMAGCRERCLEAGMDDFVGKPVAMEALFEALQRWAPAKEPAPA